MFDSLLSNTCYLPGLNTNVCSGFILLTGEEILETIHDSYSNGYGLDELRVFEEEDIPATDKVPKSALPLETQQRKRKW